MAEAFAALGAAASFLQIVDFSANLISLTYKLLRSGKDALRENIETEHLAREYKSLAKECSKSLATGSSNDGVKRLADGTRKVKRALASQKQIENRRRRLHELNGVLATRLLLDLQRHGRKSSQDCDLVASGVETENVASVQLIVARNRIKHIFRRLHYGEVSAREKAIEPAWLETYSWALTDQSSGLRTWLQAGEGVFWISGKAGSGKSTLMKFLCQQVETERLLRQWAQDNSLFRANFFFWYAGTPLQKSIPGLCMSILHQFLFTVPSLAQVAFPRAGEMSDEDEWNSDDLFGALENLASSSKPGEATAPTKICFFIDGLDEYAGDHQQLTALLEKLPQKQNVKICVSSRPWNAFRKAFESKVPNLKLEDLSKPDILKYVSDKIWSKIRMQPSEVSFPKHETDQLVHEIVDKAEGVFLWIVLVVKSVCDGITEGDAIAFLRHRVQLFPSDLEDFFRNILGRVDSAYKHQTSQALKLAWSYTQEDLDHSEIRSYLLRASSFVDFWLIRQHPMGLHADFAYDGDSTRLDCATSCRMLDETRTFLSAACKDLLHIPSNVKAESHLHDGEIPKVEFLHRTVFDFLNTRDMQTSLDEQLPSRFKDGRVFHLLGLKRLKLILCHENLDDRLEALEKTAAVSLTAVHPDLCKTFVEQFADICSGYFESIDPKARSRDRPLCMGGSEVLASFVAFQLHEIVFEYLNHEGYQLKLLDAIAPDSHRDSMWIAALGESPLRPFAFEEINPALIRKLLRTAKRARPYRDPSSCQNSVWQALIRRWQSSILKSDSSLRSSAENSFVLGIASFFLDHEAEGSKHRPDVAAVRLSAQVHSQWRQQCKALFRTILDTS